MQSSNYCRTSRSKMTVKHFVDRLFRPTARRQRGQATSLTHKASLWVVGFGSFLVSEPPIGQLKLMWKLSYAPWLIKTVVVSRVPVGLSIECRGKSIIGRKHNTKWDLLFCADHISVGDRLHELDEPLGASEEYSEIILPVWNRYHIRGECQAHW